MPRLYIPHAHIVEGQIRITGDKARYLISVLRCRKGDELIVFDGEGNCFRTMILKADRKGVITEAIEQFSSDTESPLHITLVQGLLKGEKMDMVIQKTTELGIKEIIPLIAERSQLKETKKVDRWRKIAAEAAKQCGRTIIPVIHEPVDFDHFFAGQGYSRGNSKTVEQRHDKMNGFIFWEEGGLSFKEAVLKISSSPNHRLNQSPIYLVIGPEGGFTKEEVIHAEEKGLLVASLGKRILRAETAAISTVTLVQFLLGDMG